MIYLVILVSVAGCGIFSLWLQQRRARAHLETVEGFQASLQAIAPKPVAVRRRPARRRSAPARATTTDRSARRRSVSRPRYQHGPDDARRAAARRQIEARRRERARATRRVA